MDAFPKLISFLSFFKKKNTYCLDIPKLIRDTVHI